MEREIKIDGATAEATNRGKGADSASGRVTGGTRKLRLTIGEEILIQKGDQIIIELDMEARRLVGVKYLQLTFKTNDAKLLDS